MKAARKRRGNREIDKLVGLGTKRSRGSRHGGKGKIPGSENSSKSLSASKRKRSMKRENSVSSEGKKNKVNKAAKAAVNYVLINGETKNE